MSSHSSGSKLRFQSSDPFQNMFREFFDAAQQGVTDRERIMLMALNEKILARTPVWEGDTVHNWRWSTLAPDDRHEAPVGNGPTGRTNNMPLGQEPRRAANETRPRQSLAGALRARNPTDIYLTNTADSAVALEYGLLPTPQNSRVNGSLGIVRLAIKEVAEGIY